MIEFEMTRDEDWYADLGQDEPGLQTDLLCKRCQEYIHEDDINSDGQHDPSTHECFEPVDFGRPSSSVYSYMK